LGISLGANLLIFLGVIVARLLGHSPHVEEDLPDIRNLRRVDARVYASAQPRIEHYEVLAEEGFSLVIDMRRHSRSDPKRDDETQLRELGLDYLHVPVSDGRAPNSESVDEILAAIEGADGKVLLHCGGGVGRTSAMSAAYMASKGADPSVLDQLGVGPPSIEQIYFVAATGEGDAYADNPFVDTFSRYVVDAPRRLWHLVSGI
jgi:uncharacterized protein (TIGR01244 family)